MHRLSAITLVGGVIFGLTACSTDSAAQLDDLRERFVVAGGVCSDWAPLGKPLALAAQTCAEGATLVVFNSTEDRADFIKSELETNEQIRARTHVIVCEDTWLVIDTLAVIVRVMPPMGGMISGRNCANP